ncbi:MAG TPA: DUF5000 domain-containing lipoprotein [Anseongella sp.]
MERLIKLTGCFCLSVWMSVGISGCTEGDIHGPISGDGSTPTPVSNPVVQNFPGGATITYELPNEENLLYVLAEYEIRPGVTLEAKSSNYINRLDVKGFGRAGDFQVKLYSVGRNNKRSDPVMITVQPETPPIYNAFGTISLKEGFGGMTVVLENEFKASLAVEVLTPDSLGNLATETTFYTSLEHINLPVRGFDPEERLFGVVLRDRWDNYSDTIFATLTPWFEEPLDKKLFGQMDLPTDYNSPHNGGTATMNKIWNDSQSENDFVTSPGHGLPQWFTFDLGVTARLSRLVLFKRLSNRFLYNSGAVKRWSLYGSNDPNPDGSFDESWIFLMECNSIKPSGLPPGENTNEDLEYARAGEEFLFPEDTPPVRYLRWVTHENWGNVTHVNITEIDLFGQVQ